MKYLLITFLLLGITGCATRGEKLMDVSIGMTKSQVIQVMGYPSTIKAKSGIEVLVYQINQWQVDSWTDSGAYWVFLRDGYVSEYGRPGDFGTTALPDQKYIIENH